MSEDILLRDITIFNEMMVHPALFTHPKPTKVAIISDEPSILQEVLKHQSVAEIWYISDNKTSKKTELLDNPRITQYTNNLISIADSLPFESLDVVCISTVFSKNTIFALSDLLQREGILIQLAYSLFEMNKIKKIYDFLQAENFHDIQLMQFPQHNFSWQSAFMAKKTGTFKQVREKDIFNKPFSTEFYNYDMHKAALALPEFLRKEINAT